MWRAQRSTSLISEAMSNYIIKTHRKDTVYTKPHLFVLNKGMNSGKPQKTPFTNSFVIIFSNEEDCESLFFIAYNLSSIINTKLTVWY